MRERRRKTKGHFLDTTPSTLLCLSVSLICSHDLLTFPSATASDFGLEANETFGLVLFEKSHKYLPVASRFGGVAVRGGFFAGQPPVLTIRLWRDVPSEPSVRGDHHVRHERMKTATVGSITAVTIVQ